MSYRIRYNSAIPLTCINPNKTYEKTLFYHSVNGARKGFILIHFNKLFSHTIMKIILGYNMKIFYLVNLLFKNTKAYYIHEYDEIIEHYAMDIKRKLTKEQIHIFRTIIAAYASESIYAYFKLIDMYENLIFKNLIDMNCVDILNIRFAYSDVEFLEIKYEDHDEYKEEVVDILNKSNNLPKEINKKIVDYL